MADIKKLDKDSIEVTTTTVIVKKRDELLYEKDMVESQMDLLTRRLVELNAYMALLDKE